MQSGIKPWQNEAEEGVRIMSGVPQKSRAKTNTLESGDQKSHCKEGGATVEEELCARQDREYADLHRQPDIGTYALKAI